MILYCKKASVSQVQHPAASNELDTTTGMAYSGPHHYLLARITWKDRHHNESVVRAKARNAGTGHPYCVTCTFLLRRCTNHTIAPLTFFSVRLGTVWYVTGALFSAPRSTLIRLRSFRPATRALESRAAVGRYVCHLQGLGPSFSCHLSCSR